MNEYMKAPIWDDNSNPSPPNTCQTARVVERIWVNNATVIVTPQALYRAAAFSGTFVLGKDDERTLPKSGWTDVEVFALWFGHRLKTRGPNFKINISKAKILCNYTGEVDFYIAK